MLVIDLRGNPGGLLNIAVEIAEPLHRLRTHRDRRAEGRRDKRRALSANEPGLAGECRLYVLVDHDARRAPARSWRCPPGSPACHDPRHPHLRQGLPSRASFRSGRMPAGLKLTTAKFYSPRNRPYSEQGVQPDIPITLRSAAKPTEDGSIPREESNFGDPQRDPVLATRTIRTAKSQLPTAR